MESDPIKLDGSIGLLYRSKLHKYEALLCIDKVLEHWIARWIEDSTSSRKGIHKEPNDIIAWEISWNASYIYFPCMQIALRWRPLHTS